MCPDIIQFLTFMAGRTTHAKVGSMVTILPWHDPVRLAEQIIMLDHLSKGRLILGIGRGTGKVEFDGFRLDMSKSRQTFIESAEAILSALETGVMEYDGEIIKQPRVELRPGPYKSFKNRVFSASVSPESAKIMADLGTGLLVVPQKPWKRVLEDVENFRKSFDDAFRRRRLRRSRRPWCWSTRTKSAPTNSAASTLVGIGLQWWPTTNSTSRI